MYSLPKNVYRERIDFSKIKTTVPIPNLIEIQKKSYERFLQMNRLPSEREDVGLQSVFKSVFPISDFRENSSLEFIEYSIGNWECKCGRLTGLEHLRKKCDGLRHDARRRSVRRGRGDLPVVRARQRGARRRLRSVRHDRPMKLKYDVEECQERGMTFAVPLKVTIRLVVWNKDPETGVKTIRDIKEQEVYFGDIPLMGDHGTFIINGTERVIVSQLHRSPGAFFHTEDKALYVAQIIPYRGSWVEFEYDAKNLLYVRIDRKRKFLATVFLRALGLRGADEILRDVLHGRRARAAAAARSCGRSSDCAGRPAVRGGVPDPGVGAGAAPRQEDPQGPGRGAEEGRRRRGRARRHRARGRVRRHATSSIRPRAKSCSRPTRSSPSASSRWRRRRTSSASRSSSPRRTRSARSCRRR